MMQKMVFIIARSDLCNYQQQGAMVGCMLCDGESREGTICQIAPSGLLFAGERVQPPEVRILSLIVPNKPVQSDFLNTTRPAAKLCRVFIFQIKDSILVECFAKPALILHLE
jgi:hypothetical protein